MEEFLEEWKVKSRKEIEEEIENLKKLEKKYKNDIDYYNSIQQALKIGLNSQYGSCVNKYFAMYCQEVGASITAMGRDVIQYITKEIDDWFHNEWHLDTELHEALNLGKVQQIPEKIGLIQYIDTDSISWDSKIKTEKNGTFNIHDLYNDCIHYGNNGETAVGHESVVCPYKVLNYTKDNGVHYTEVERLIRHKVTKKKWKLKSISGKEVIVTNDHSLVVFRDGIQVTVKPIEIIKGDKVLIVLPITE